MKIDLYTFIYNDADILPFFLKYYSFVDRMTFIDSGSNDDSIRILKDYATEDKPEVRVTQTGLTWWDHEKLHIYRNEIWRNSTYDYIFFPDADEFFYHPDIKKYIEKSKNDIYEMCGFDMISDKFPAPGSDILSIKTGMYFQIYNKSTIFKPTCDIQFLNAHIRYSSSTSVDFGNIKLLHYRYLGLDHVKKRRDREKSRLPKNYRARQAQTDEWLKNRFDYVKSQSRVVI